MGGFKQPRNKGTYRKMKQCLSIEKSPVLLAGFLFVSQIESGFQKMLLDHI